MNHRINAGMFIVHNEQILMVRHRIIGQYDLWVPPGGGVQGLETLEEAAEREVFEETGICAKAERLMYIEEFILVEARQCKFWFLGRFIDGTLDISAPEAQNEDIVEAAWLRKNELLEREVFPTFLPKKFWQDLEANVFVPQYCGFRKNETTTSDLA